MSQVVLMNFIDHSIIPSYKTLALKNACTYGCMAMAASDKDRSNICDDVLVILVVNNYKVENNAIT